MAPTPSPRLLWLVALAAAGAPFLALSLDALQRPLWNDELTAMANYPLDGWRAIFEPLPLYSQAAPPLFNVIAGAIAGLDPLVGRLILQAVISAGMMLAVLAVFPTTWAAATTAFVGVTVSEIIPFGSELKYFGLEMLGTALAIAWVLRKDPGAPLGLRDLGLLVLSTCLGVSGMVIGVVALATHGVFRLIARTRIGAGEAALAAGFLGFVLLYYLLIQHGTRIQILTYADVYAVAGVAAVRDMALSIRAVAGPAFVPLGALAVAAACLDLRDRRTQRFLLLSALTVGAFAALAFIGKYPASAARHVAWAAAFYLFLAVNGVAILVRRWPTLDLPRRAVAVTLVGIAASWALVPALGTLRQQNAYVVAENDRIVEWLEASPPRSIGLWAGGQPVIDYFDDRSEGVTKHSYFGRLNAGSAIVPPELMDGLDAETAAAVEAQRDQPGAWGRNIVYRMALDYAEPARSLLVEAPRGAPFYILASHIHLETSNPLEAARNEGLIEALHESGCRFAPELVVLRAYILRASCP